MTYARRYGLSALLGMVCEPDDDGNAASFYGNHEATERPPATTPPQNRPIVSQKAKGAPNDSQDAIAALPKLDGIEYSATQQNGKLCIIASGKTYNKKKLLFQSGFQWDDQQKHWWRCAEAA